MRRIWNLGLVLLLGACTSSTGPLADAGGEAPRDARPDPDAGAATATDAAPPLDGGLADGGSADGDSDDAGEPDASGRCREVTGAQWPTMLSAPDGALWVGSVALDGDGFALSGAVVGDGRDAVAVRTAGDGTVRWARTLGRARGDPDGVLLADGSQIVAFTKDGGEGLRLVRLTAEGSVDWGKTVTVRSPWASASTARVTAAGDGGAVVAASLSPASPGETADAILLIRFGPAGDVLYARELWVSHFDLGTVAALPDGRVAVTATSDSFAERWIETPFGYMARVRETWLAMVDAGGNVDEQLAISTNVGRLHMMNDVEHDAGSLRLAGTVDVGEGALFGGLVPWVVRLADGGRVVQSVGIDLPLFGCTAQRLQGRTLVGTSGADVWVGRIEGSTVDTAMLDAALLSGSIDPAGELALATGLGACDAHMIPEACGDTRRDLMLLRFPRGEPSDCAASLVGRRERRPVVEIPAVARDTDAERRDASATVEPWSPEPVDAALTPEPICFASTECGGVRREGP